MPRPFLRTPSLTHVLDESRPRLRPEAPITQWTSACVPAGRRPGTSSTQPRRTWPRRLYDIARYLAGRVPPDLLVQQPPQPAAEELEEAYYLECALLTVLLAMENTGVYTDMAVIEAIGRQLDADIRMLQLEIWKICGEQFELTLKSKLRTTSSAPRARGGQGPKPLTYTEKTNEPQLNKAVMEHYADSNLVGQGAPGVDREAQAQVGVRSVTHRGPSQRPHPHELQPAPCGDRAPLQLRAEPPAGSSAEEWAPTRAPSP